MTTDPKNQELSDDKEDALLSEEDALNQSEIISGQMSREHDTDLLNQANRSSESSFELGID